MRALSLCVLLCGWPLAASAQAQTSFAPAIIVHDVRAGDKTVVGSVDIELLSTVSVISVTVARGGAVLDSAFVAVEHPTGRFEIPIKVRLAENDSLSFAAFDKHEKRAMLADAGPPTSLHPLVASATVNKAPEQPKPSGVVVFRVGPGDTTVTGRVDMTLAKAPSCVVVRVDFKNDKDVLILKNLTQTHELGKNGEFEVPLSAALSAKDTVTVWPGDEHCQSIVDGTANLEVPPLPASADAPLKELSTADTRMTTGLAFGAPSGSAVSAGYVIDFTLAAPLARPAHRHLDNSFAFPNLLMWSTVRLGGASQSATGAIKEVVSGFDGSIGSASVTQFAQTLSVRGGLEYKYGNGTEFGEGTKDHYVFQPSVYVGIGLTTPMSDSERVKIFDLTPAAREQFGLDDKFTYVAIQSADRHRLLRQWEVGVRLKTHHMEGARELAFPGIVDISVGQDEQLTGGRLKKFVLSVDAFYPLPVENLGRSLYVFGFVRSLLQKEDEHPSPLVLTTPKDSVSLSDPLLTTVSLSAAETYNRDKWRFGVGVDLISLFNAMRKPAEKK